MTRKWFYRRAWAAQVEKGNFCSQCGSETGSSIATLCIPCYLFWVDETRAEKEEEEQPCQQK